LIIYGNPVALAFLYASLRGTKQSPVSRARVCKAITYHVQPLIAAEATTFVLIQKVAKTERSELMNTYEEQTIAE
jgi:hypothetical protein